MQKLLLSGLLLVPLVASVLQGCIAAAAGVVGGVLVSKEVLTDEVYVGLVDIDSHRTWTTIKTMLNNASLKPIDVDDDRRVANAEIDDGKVTVSVETFDLNRTQFRVSATKFGVSSGAIAKRVFDRIVSDLQQR